MRHRVAIWSGFFIVAALGAYAVGQQQPTERGTAASFAVSPAGDAAVLLDTRSGQTWILTHSADKSNPSAWLPAVKID